MTQTDHKMVHFQSFNVNPANYTIPGPLLDGIPLFHHSGQTISEPQVSRQLNQRLNNILIERSFFSFVLQSRVLLQEVVAVLCVMKQWSIPHYFS